MSRSKISMTYNYVSNRFTKYYGQSLLHDVLGLARFNISSSSAIGAKSIIIYDDNHMLHLNSILLFK